MFDVVLIACRPMLTVDADGRRHENTRELWYVFDEKCQTMWKFHFHSLLKGSGLYLEGFVCRESTSVYIFREKCRLSVQLSLYM